MILNKLFISLSFVLFLNSCAQNAALLGPAITGVSTGSVYQAGLSYGSAEVIKKVTGKTPTENIKQIMEDSNKAKKTKTNDDFFLLVKSSIEKNSEIIDLANQ
jgi:hypothetical protein